MPITPQAVQELLNELQAPRASRQRAWDNLQKIRWLPKDKSIVPVRIQRFDMAPFDCRDDDRSGTLLRRHWGATPTTGGAHSSPPARASTFWINKLLAGLPA
jgi:hypothetical protein